MLRSLMLSLLLVGCGETVAEQRTGDESTAATSFIQTAPSARLTFDASWHQTVAGPLTAGGVLVLDYDAARLPVCRASHNGNPGWQITASVLFHPSEQLVERGLFEHINGPTGPDYYSWVHTTPELQIPSGTTSVELWFKNTSGFDQPCERWDSNYNQNYRFAVASPSTASMAFGSDWRNVVTGTIARGGSLQLSYSTDRMKSIVDNAKSPGTSIGYFASKYHCYGYGCCSFSTVTTANVRFHANEAFTSTVVGASAVALQVPADADRVELYFDGTVTTETWYCGGTNGAHSTQGPDHFYDSNWGHNFVYVLP